MKWTSLFATALLIGSGVFHSGLFASSSPNSQVLFVNPGHAEESFWHDVDLYAKAAAKTLNIDLDIIYGERDVDLTLQRLSDRIQNQPIPDYIILVNEAQSGRALLDIVAGTSSRVLFALNDLTPDEKVDIQQDTEWQQRLLPGVFPNNFRIGYLTAQALYRQGNHHYADALLLSGDQTTPASLQRKAGALAFIEQVDGQYGVHHSVGQWQEERAYAEAHKLLSYYPNIRYIWTANDHMAYGAQRALQEGKKVIGENVFISTINTSERALKQLKQGDISILGGGHFTAIGLALVKIHQRNIGRAWPQRTKFTLFHLIEPDTPLYRLLLDKQWQDIDFNAIDLLSNPVDPYLQKND
ncbi:ABC transporter substrate-binding protein [Vibrio methylphosphonaticus]|uniref:ABC transporter substrate-binding protein n=1 Tax=Vibrio methylphosphonaticus TaxID=2946866 RepID=UPI00202A6F25|nr:ABC transporter substrate-binding protein [Vibrio methylphosphonaticus]MCL9774261.1 ABC transporter substrate-binding protein [Vibrio methylphosphonaticus]